MLIGLIGLKGSGKDTLVNSLSAKYGEKKIINLKYANGLKKMLEDYFDIPKEIYEHPTIKEARIVHGTRFTVRQLMIKIGSFFREINPNFWVNYTMNQYNALKELYPNAIIIITDCRYPNEIKAIRHRGGVILDVRRDDIYIKERRIINRYGVNLISKLMVKRINPLLTDSSEWNYFVMTQKREYQIIDNTSLQNGIEQLENFIFKP